MSSGSSRPEDISLDLGLGADSGGADSSTPFFNTIPRSVVRGVPDEDEVSRRPKALGAKPKAKMRRLLLLDATTMVNLFDISYDWGVRVKAAGITTLIQSFFQFAREVDTGDVTSISFSISGSQAKEAKASAAGGGGGGSASSLAGHTRKVSRLRTTPAPKASLALSPPAQSMKLNTLKQENILAALFHDDTKGVDERATLFLKLALEAFIKDYSKLVMSLSKELNEISESQGKGATVDVEPIESKFKGFADSLDKIFRYVFDSPA